MFQSGERVGRVRMNALVMKTREKKDALFPHLELFSNVKLDPVP